MKRARADSLTGGTHDVNPQTLGGRILLTAANTFSQSTIPVPVMRVGMSSQLAQVIEALWIEFDQSDFEDFDNAEEGVEMQLTTVSKNANVLVDDVDIIAKWSFTTCFLTSGLALRPDITKIDLTDGAGHGLIIATPNIFFGANSTGLAAAGTAAFRMGYRFKNVSLQEYVGLAIQFGQST